MLISMMLIIMMLIINHLFCQPRPELLSPSPTSPNSLWDEIVPLGTHLIIVMIMMGMIMEDLMVIMILMIMMMIHVVIL